MENVTDKLETPRLGVWFRRAVLWATGRDLMAPALPIPRVGSLTISGPPEPLWEMTLSSYEDLRFSLPTGPNVLHRVAQRFALGIRWRMLPKTHNA
jgi:hypothetical protein